MNEKECLSVYNELIQYLHELKLDWVVKQVKQSLEEGKIRKIENSRRNHQETIEKYTPKEQLILLIDSIQRAIIDTFDIQNEVYKFLTQEFEINNTMRDITFISSDEEETETIHFSESSFKQSLLKKEEIQQLKNDLRQLRSEVLNSAY